MEKKTLLASELEELLEAYNDSEKPRFKCTPTTRVGDSSA